MEKVLDLSHKEMKYFTHFYNRIPQRWKNRYAIASLLFFVWMCFFDNNNFLSQISLKMELNELYKQKEIVLKEIGIVKSDHDELLNNPKEQERFAREKYWMKKDDEDIFIIVRK